MEKLLISLTIRTRVEPDPNELIRALSRATERRGRLWVLGTNGSRRALQGEQLALFGNNDRFMQYAKAGLLYYEPEPEQAEEWAFSPGADAGTKLPVLLEGYDVAFRKRSYMGEGAEAAKDEKAQATLPLG